MERLKRSGILVFLGVLGLVALVTYRGDKEVEPFSKKVFREKKFQAGNAHALEPKLELLEYAKGAGVPSGPFMTAFLSVVNICKASEDAERVRSIWDDSVPQFKEAYRSRPMDVIHHLDSLGRQRIEFAGISSSAKELLEEFLQSSETIESLKDAEVRLWVMRMHSARGDLQAGDREFPRLRAFLEPRILEGQEYLSMWLDVLQFRESQLEGLEFYEEAERLGNECGKVKDLRASRYGYYRKTIPLGRQ